MSGDEIGAAIFLGCMFLAGVIFVACAKMYTDDVLEREAEEDSKRDMERRIAAMEREERNAEARKRRAAEIAAMERMERKNAESDNQVRDYRV